MELYRRIIFKKTLINNNYKNLGIVNNLFKKKKIYIPYDNFKIVLKDAIIGKTLVETINFPTGISGEIISVVIDETSGGYIENFQKNYQGINCSCFIDNGLFNSEFYMSLTIFYI